MLVVEAAVLLTAVLPGRVAQVLAVQVERLTAVQETPEPQTEVVEVEAAVLAQAHLLLVEAQAVQE